MFPDAAHPDLRHTSRGHWIVWMTVLATSVVVLAGAVAGPRPAFATLCHQLAGRSFVIDGHLFAVCHRCTGIYAGIVIGLTLVPFGPVFHLVRRCGLFILALSAGLVAADAGLDVVGLVSNTTASRFLTGLVLGITAGAFLGLVSVTDHVHRRSGAGMTSSNTTPSRISNTEYRIPEYRIPNTEYRIPNTEYRVPESRIPNNESTNSPTEVRP